MTAILGVNELINNPTIRRWGGLAKSYARIIDSRESTYRLALDIVAFDIPSLAASAFRNFWNFMEALWEAAIGSLMVCIAPKITSKVGKIAAFFILDEKEKDHTEHYLMFQMHELESTDSMKEAIKNRILHEESEDQKRLKDIYLEFNKNDKAEIFEENTKKVNEFFSNFNPDDKIREKILKLKKAVILGESFIEGGVWGSFGLHSRAFRKYILRKDRFTGTMGYLEDSESAGLGEGGELTLWQKIGGTICIFLSPMINSILLKKTQNKEAISKNRFLKIADEHLDMTHGIYPKLGLLFSYTSVPKWTGTFITSQGWYERVERIIKFLTILPSWWLGHRLTNGTIAQKADKFLAEKYGVDKGILIEPKYLKPKEENKEYGFWDKLNFSCPEPARIPHVLERIEKSNPTKGSKEDLLNDAKDLHAKTLYKGFALHSFLIWTVIMAVNYTTKLRVKFALGR